MGSWKGGTRQLGFNSSRDDQACSLNMSVNCRSRDRQAVRLLQLTAILC